MNYKTVKEFSSDEFCEKRSRFIGYIMPVATEDDAVKFINSIKSKHWDATHNVYAYVLREGQTRRYSDDGEPGGTAGVPVLDVILKEGLTDVAVVVTRYFGGILLGGGGLVRAYSHSAKIAVDSAQIMEMCMCRVLRAEMDYSWYSQFQRLLPQYNARVVDSDFGAAVRLDILIRDERADSLLKDITELTSATVTPYEIEKKYADLA